MEEFATQHPWQTAFSIIIIFSLIKSFVSWMLGTSGIAEELKKIREVLEELTQDA